MFCQEQSPVESCKQEAFHEDFVFTATLSTTTPAMGIFIFQLIWI